MGKEFLFGACAEIDDVPVLKEVGYDFWECNVQHVLMPDTDADHRQPVDGPKWKETRKRVLSMGLPVRSANCLFPSWFRLLGPDASWEGMLAYVGTACRHADELGLKYVVFGSSGVRAAPAGFPLDKAIDGFVEFCRRFADATSGCAVEIVLEPLQPNEVNYFNFVREGNGILSRIGSPRFHLLADIYHMMAGGEGPDSILGASGELSHVHVAERGSRQAPGTDPSRMCDFRPYFDALRAIGYSGGISCECGWSWGENEDIRAARVKALEALRSL